MKKRLILTGCILIAAGVLTSCGWSWERPLDLLREAVGITEPETGQEDVPEEAPAETPAAAAPEAEDPGPEEGPGVKDSLFSFFDPSADESYQDVLPEGESLFRNEAVYYYYYGILSTEEQQVYDALIDITRDPTVDIYRKGVTVSVDPSGKQFSQWLSRAYQAMIFDHPELFWFRQDGGNFRYYYPSRPDRDGQYRVMFRLSGTYDAYEEEMTAFNAAAEAFLADIDRTQPAPVLALEIHDKLLDMVTYDTGLADVFLGDDQSYDYGYSAYGALVQNSRGVPHTAVCDGYSYAYEYLLQQVGVEVTRVGGNAGDTEAELMPHSWNLVRLDGEWYEVDPTWDDQEIDFDTSDPANQLLTEAVNDPVYWGRIRHHLFLLTTGEMRSFVPDDLYVYYTDHGYATFLGTSVHLREAAGGAPDPLDYLSCYAPVAEGTLYRYDPWTQGIIVSAE